MKPFFLLPLFISSPLSSLSHLVHLSLLVYSRPNLQPPPFSSLPPQFPSRPAPAQIRAPLIPIPAPKIQPFAPSSPLLSPRFEDRFGRGDRVLGWCFLGGGGAADCWLQLGAAAHDLSVVVEVWDFGWELLVSPVAGEVSRRKAPFFFFFCSFPFLSFVGGEASGSLTAR